MVLYRLPTGRGLRVFWARLPDPEQTTKFIFETSAVSGPERNDAPVKYHRRIVTFLFIFRRWLKLNNNNNNNIILYVYTIV